MRNQEKVWDKIAKEWHEYKKIPSSRAEVFLESCSGNVLDLGSGSGRHLTKIKKGKMYLQDFSSEMLKLAEGKAKELEIDAEFVHSTMEKIPFEDDFFDYAICISALHCVEGKENRLEVVKELNRVLKRNGKAYIGVWNKNSKRFKKRKNKEQMIGWTDKGDRYYYLYEEKEIHELFKKNNFRIISIHNSEMMINFVVQK